MMTAMEWFAMGLALLFAVLGLACLVLTAVGLPGTWLMVGLAAVTALLKSGLGNAGDTSLWWTIAACVGLAGIGEVIETAAGAAGSHAGGGTRRGMVGAIVGGIAGSIVLTPLLPVPLLGTLVGAVIGTFAGALVAELTGESAPPSGDSLRAAAGATVGRLIGSMGKTLIAVLVWVVLTFGLFTT